MKPAPPPLYHPCYSRGLVWHPWLIIKNWSEVKFKITLQSFAIAFKNKTTIYWYRWKLEYLNYSCKYKLVISLLNVLWMEDRMHFSWIQEGGEGQKKFLKPNCKSTAPPPPPSPHAHKKTIPPLKHLSNRIFLGRMHFLTDSYVSFSYWNPWCRFNTDRLNRFVRSFVERACHFIFPPAFC